MYIPQAFENKMIYPLRSIKIELFFYIQYDFWKKEIIRICQIRYYLKYGVIFFSSKIEK